jgi:predicted lipoprotein with Yx(FWY)xxD motif
MPKNIRFPMRRLLTIGIILFTGLFIAACSSSATTGKAALSTKTGSATVVTTHTGPDGTYLTDSTGKTLYLFAADTGTTSTCAGQCATFWPPLVTSGAPTAGSGVTASMLSTTKRADGTTQVDYNGHPLYYFAGDKAVGQTTGQGINQSGGLWWLVAPNGNAIMTK